MADEDSRLKQIGDNLRFYGDMRFKQLTLFSGAMAAFGTGIARDSGTMLTLGISFRFAIAIAGLLFTTVIWVMEVRSSAYWAAMRGQASSIWPRPLDTHWRLLNATNAVVLFYAASFCFWLKCGASWSYHPGWVLVIGCLMLLMMILFTVSHYKHLWFYRENQPEAKEPEKT